MIAASRSANFSALARRSIKFTLPSTSQPTATTSMPAMCAEAGDYEKARVKRPGGGSDDTAHAA
jgi:hypothetical protein